MKSLKVVMGKRLKFIVSALLIFILVFFVLFLVQAKDFTPQEMVERSENIMQGDNNIMHMVLGVITPSWQREYEINSWMKGHNRTLIRLINPSKKKGESYLKHNLQLWLYMPKVERKILIPPSSMLQPFLGSDFSYDDLVKASRLAKDYDCRLVDKDTIRGEETLLIKLIPKPEAPVIYGGLKIWLRNTDYVPLRHEFYNEDGQLLKTLDFFDVRFLGGHIIPTVWEMTNNLETGRKTTIKVLDAKFEVPMKDDIFSRHKLERYEKN